LALAGRKHLRLLRWRHEIVHYLADRGKIHQVHMRNIRGGLNNFEEVYPDEGEMDFLKIMSFATRN
jgi:D-mannonate dehydratase